MSDTDSGEPLVINKNSYVQLPVSIHLINVNNNVYWLNELIQVIVRFAPITCSPRVDSPWVVSPRKVSRFAPLNCYYIIIDEIFFNNFLEVIYLLVVCKKNNNSFILVYFCQRSQFKLFLQNLQKQHTRTVKSFFFFLYQRKSAWNDWDAVQVRK